MRIEDQYTDVLQNIEFAIVDTYRRNPDMPDYEVMRAVHLAASKMPCSIPRRNENGGSSLEMSACRSGCWNG